MSLDWQAVVGTMTNVQKLVHLAARYDSVDEERIRAELLAMRRRSYNDELSIQAARVGCDGRRGNLGNGDILNGLNEESKRDAESIANTYNYFLALEIVRAGQENPKANRYYYAAKIGEWSPTYWAYKDDVITTTTDKGARSLAQQDFYNYNGGAIGTAKLEPRSAVCPVCAGWIARGVVPLRVALSAPPPYHINCPHTWDIRPEKVAKEECPLLWMGE